MYSAFFDDNFDNRIKMQWLKNLKTILDKPYGQYVITLFALTLFLHQLNIYVFNRIEESNAISKIDVKIEVPQSEFVTLQPKEPNLDFQCQCKELEITNNESLCSDYASSRGNDQKVISISYFNQEIPKLRKLVEDTYATIGK